MKDRDAATNCLNQLNGKKLHGLELRIGWGKSVPLPTVNAIHAPVVPLDNLVHQQHPQPGIETITNITSVSSMGTGAGSAIAIPLPQSGKAQIAARMESFPDDIKVYYI